MLSPKSMLVEVSIVDYTSPSAVSCGPPSTFDSTLARTCARLRIFVAEQPLCFAR